MELVSTDSGTWNKSPEVDVIEADGAFEGPKGTVGVLRLGNCQWRRGPETRELAEAVGNTGSL